RGRRAGRQRQQRGENDGDAHPAILLPDGLAAGVVGRTLVAERPRPAVRDLVDGGDVAPAPLARGEHQPQTNGVGLGVWHVHADLARAVVRAVAGRVKIWIETGYTGLRAIGRHGAMRFATCMPATSPARRLDFSQHMNGVVEVSTEELWARVQPGLVQDELNHHVRGLGLLFGPDTSTSNRATLGGMIGNNSGGSHSIAYGLTVEHVLELDALLADGTRVRFGTVTPAEFEAKARLEGAEGRIYREVAAIRAEYADEIRRRYPKHWRRVAGYNLNELVKPGNLNMARVLVGSEGTLLTVLEAKVRLVRRPKKTALDVIH